MPNFLIHGRYPIVKNRNCCGRNCTDQVRRRTLADTIILNHLASHNRNSTILTNFQIRQKKPGTDQRTEPRWLVNATRVAIWLRYLVCYLSFCLSLDMAWDSPLAKWSRSWLNLNHRQQPHPPWHRQRSARLWPRRRQMPVRMRYLRQQVSEQQPQRNEKYERFALWFCFANIIGCMASGMGGGMEWVEWRVYTGVPPWSRGHYFNSQH